MASTPRSGPRWGNLAIAIAVPTTFLLAGVVALGAIEEPASDPRPAEPRPDESELPDITHLFARGRRGPIEPLRDPRPEDPARVALGERLFHDPGLSGDGSVSCASCHDLAQGGDDGRRVSIGIDGQLGQRNAPTVLNSGLNVRQFWDGRAATLEEQAGEPIENPVEMGSDWDTVLAHLERDATYVAAFREAFGAPPSREGVRRAIAAFERTLVTTGAPFDRYLLGDPSAVNEAVVRGYETFRRMGCITCHQGENVGGNMMQPLGRMLDYFDEVEERGQLFKVPSLRNVALTAPYFHDGSVETLAGAIEIMARHQLGLDPSPEEVADVERFLVSLSGRQPTSGEEDPER